MVIEELLQQYDDLSFDELAQVIGHTLGFPPLELFLHRRDPLPEEKLPLLQSVLKRLRVEPLQYVLGHWDFCGMSLQVTKDTLIPRPETEELVEWICESVKNPQRILDIGTGTGAIALALGHAYPRATVRGVDLSEKALQVAEANRRSEGLTNVSFTCADLFDGGEYDLIVSNPPYISKEEMQSLDAKVLQEPTMALCGGEDGLDFYRRIVAGHHFLSPAGDFFFEIGHGQGKALLYLLEAHGFQATLRRDLSGRERMVRGRR